MRLASFILAVFFFLLSEGSWAAPQWTIQSLLLALAELPSGRLVLERARAKNPNFMEVIHIGEASITENTFTRSYSLLDGKESIGIQESISIGRALHKAEAVADLAHELTHYARKRFRSPYQLDLSREEFVREGIEGPGGELEAFEMECQVVRDLEKFAYPANRLCLKYQGTEGFDRDAARRDYYALGEAWPMADRKMKQGLPELSSQKLVFSSSYMHQAYPLALAREYEETRGAACANNQRKRKLIAKQKQRLGRAPATLHEEEQKIADYEQKYCDKSRASGLDFNSD